MLLCVPLVALLIVPSAAVKLHRLNIATRLVRRSMAKLAVLPSGRQVGLVKKQALTVAR